MHRMLPEVLDWPFKEGITGAGVGNYSQKEATQFFNQVGLLILMCFSAYICTEDMINK